MNKPKVTIACITFNHEKYVKNCLEGIFMQVCNFDFEVIIHDDCSTDNTQNIIREFIKDIPLNIKLIFQEINQYSKGKKPLIDFILPIATGEYIAFCEGDDFWTDPYKLQKQINILDNNLDIAFCSHNVNRVNEFDEVLLPGIEEEGSMRFYSSGEIINSHFPTLSLVFRNVKLNYSESLKKAFNGDAVLTALLSLHGGAVNLGTLAASYRVHSNGVFSSQSYHENEVQSIISRRIMLKSRVFPSNYNKLFIKNIRKRKFNLFKFHIKRGSISKAFSVLFNFRFRKN